MLQYRSSTVNGQTGPVPKKQQLVVLEINYRTSDEQHIDEDEDNSFIDEDGNVIDRKTSFIIDATTGYLINEDGILIDKETGDPIEDEDTDFRYFGRLDSTNNSPYGASASRRFFNRTTPTPITLSFRYRNITTIRTTNVNTSLYNLDLRNFTNSALVDETII